MDSNTDQFVSSSRSVVNGSGHVRADSLDGGGSLLTPVFERVRGQCLELGVASEEWTQFLESLATQVVSVESVADDVHSTVPTATFDTVVAACRTNTLYDVAVAARHALRRDGALLLAVDGWSHHLQTANRSPIRALARAFRGNAWSVRRTLQQAGFEEITLYGVFPSVADPKFIYPLSDDSAIEWFVENRLNGWMGIAAQAAHTVGMFGEGQPGYLAVYDAAAGGPSPESAVTRVSLNRVLTFELDGGDLVRVRKAPRANAGDATIRREQRVLDTLLDDEVDVPDAVTSTLPAGSLSTSPMGTVRSESPVAGTPIGDRLDADPATVRDVLDVAFDWLASFQQAYRGETVVRDSDDLHRRASCPKLGVTDPPSLRAPVTSFVAPCHGDFHLWNVYADDSGVTTVIDWEYATRRSDPAIDPAHFLLYVCAHVGEDFEAGFETLCASETPYSTAVRASLDRYCEQVGLSRRTVVGALPYAHVHTLRTLRELGEPPAYPELCRKYEPRLATIAANFENVVETLG